MATYFITRHTGAVDWAHQEGFDVTNLVSHADESFFSSLKAGDKVIGILPVSLAFHVCHSGAEFYDLALPNLPVELRGKELTAAQMRECGAKVTRYIVTTNLILNRGTWWEGMQ